MNASRVTTGYKFAYLFFYLIVDVVIFANVVFSFLDSLHTLACDCLNIVVVISSV